MKLIVSRKKEAPKGDSLIATLNTGMGSTFKFLPDNEVDAYISSQALRGYVCHEFQHIGTYETQATIVKSAVA